VIESLSQDVRYGLRVFLSKPGFTVVAVITLALGIGASTAIFSVVNGVLLKPLPYREPQRLVQFWETNPPKGWTEAVVAPANFFDWQAQSGSFEEMGAYIGSDTRSAGITGLQMTGNGPPVLVKALYVTGNVFSVLGADAALGRTLTSDETWAGHEKVAVLSNGIWKRRFGSDPDIIGKKIQLDGSAVEVVGIMPAGFYFPSQEAELWIPMGWNQTRLAQVRRPHFLRVIGRLKTGVSIEQAQSEMTGIAERLEQQYPRTNTQMGVGLGPMLEWIVSDTRTVLLTFLAAVAFLLLIACANVANLMLVRAAGRTREIALRVALGASRFRIARQLLIESVILSLIGGGLGVMLAAWGTDILLGINPDNIPRLGEISINPPVLGFALVVSILTSLIFGLAPALGSSNPDLSTMLKEGGQKGTVSHGGKLRSVLVASEVALSCILVIGAGLVVKSFIRLQQVDPGFQPDHLLTFKISLRGKKYSEAAQSNAFFNSLEQKVRSLAGVQGFALVTRLPLKGYPWTSDFTIEGRSPEEFGKEVRHKEITPDYFETLGIPMIAGRKFDESDGPNSVPVVIVNEALARMHFQSEDPIGKRLKFSKPTEDDTWNTIVGVVKDTKQDGLRKAPRPEIFQPLLQNPQSDMMLAVRTAVTPASLLPAMNEQIHALDPDLALSEIATGEQLIHASLGGDRFAMFLLSLFAGAALLLAAVGIYGVMSYSVAQRTHEMGLRMALGAQARDVVGLVVRGGLKVSLSGVSVGVVAAYGLTRLIERLLFGVSATDPVTFVFVSLMLVGVALVACFIPARRSSRVDPMVALRYE